jgi:hypothetical protein
MKVKRLDGSGDWCFGLSNADYLTGSDSVRQNVATRIKSFRDDWFLDMDAEIDWFSILGNKNNEKTILFEVERVTKDTEGVKSISNLAIIQIDKRTATIQLEFTTVYDEDFRIEVNI